MTSIERPFKSVEKPVDVPEPDASAAARCPGDDGPANCALAPSRTGTRAAGMLIGSAAAAVLCIAGCDNPAPSNFAREERAPTAEETPARAEREKTGSPVGSQAPHKTGFFDIDENVAPSSTGVSHSARQTSGAAAGHGNRTAPSGRPASDPQPVFRPSDMRPRHDAARLAKLGIREFASSRLKLYTDVDPETAGTLPAVIDQAYRAWEEYFGPLPPNREGTEYQMTGYLMADRELFRTAGLLPDDLPPFLHGRHRGDEFWIHEQVSDYYRRHLVIHEATHCFMTTLPDGGAPVWYMEGMAELFGTHVLHEDGTVTFGVMPHNDQDFLGLGRIRMIRAAVAGGRIPSLENVAALGIDDYRDNEAYAWSWALCEFLDSHPGYRERFHRIARQLPQFNFERAFAELYQSDLPELRTQWLLFATGLEYGFDVARSAVDFQPGEPLKAESPERQIDVAAGRSWQASGVHITQGDQYEIVASGQVSLGTQPQPWISEPQGISIYYSQGRPIGMLLAAIRADTGSTHPGEESMLHSIEIGRGTKLTAPATGTLYFRVNDFWSSVADNTGSFQVRIGRAAPP